LKLDILALAAHPDDVELCCGGTIAKHIDAGHRVGVVDFTEGELGTRGTREIRLQEAERATQILGLTVRENLGFSDGFFENNKAHKLRVVQSIRKYQPEVVFINAPNDRHPDHGRAHQLAKEACFMAGLRAIKTEQDGEEQQAWRPKTVYSYIQGWSIHPDIVVDVSDHWSTKMEAILAFKSQFHDPESSDPETFLSTPEFLQFIEGRGREWGQAIGVKYGEGFNIQRVVGVNDITTLL